MTTQAAMTIQAIAIEAHNGQAALNHHTDKAADALHALADTPTTNRPAYQVLYDSWRELETHRRVALATLNGHREELYRAPSWRPATGADLLTQSEIDAENAEDSALTWQELAERAS